MLSPLHTESEIFACVFPFFCILHPFLSKCMQRMRKRRKSNLIRIFVRKFRTKSSDSVCRPLEVFFFFFFLSHHRTHWYVNYPYIYIFYFILFIYYYYYYYLFFSLLVNSDICHWPISKLGMSQSKTWIKPMLFTITDIKPGTSSCTKFQYANMQIWKCKWDPKNLTMALDSRKW